MLSLPTHNMLKYQNIEGWTYSSGCIFFLKFKMYVKYHQFKYVSNTSTFCEVLVSSILSLLPYLVGLVSGRGSLGNLVQMENSCHKYKR